LAQSDQTINQLGVSTEAQFKGKLEQFYKEAEGAKMKCS
jgi:hypothetical protein